MNDSEYRQLIFDARIDELYLMILNKITGGKIFGETIDISCIKQMVVSAYLLGQTQKLEEYHLV